LVDLALALRLSTAGGPVVANDVSVGAGERIVVITGPNQAGKTTLARAIGQLARLATIGVPVPAASATITLADDVHTLFARAEDPADLTGRLEAELIRARAILDGAGPRSLVIVNEAFASTTVDDSLALDRALLTELTARGATCVVVTFLGELASFDDTTVSLAEVVDPDDPSRPTYRFARRPADDLAHARVVAAAHGLDYDTVRARIAR
jgi:DNA mismatch repair ATPase MutS